MHLLIYSKLSTGIVVASVIVVILCFAACEALERSTRFWPIVITETILGNLMSVSL
jgi:hypothetical protein